MNHKEYLKLITEAPIAYDDETRAFIGKNAKWTKIPDKKFNLEELNAWVKHACENGQLQYGHFGQGDIKIAKMNDRKTVFKFASGTDHNGQIKREVETWKEYGSRFNNVMAKIFEFGDLWIIQEFCEDIKDKFESITKVSTSEWNFGYNDYVMKYPKIKKILEDKKIIDKKTAVFNMFNDAGWIVTPKSLKIIDNKNLLEIIEFSAISGIGDLHIGNLGLRNGNKIVIIDYGMSS